MQKPGPVRGILFDSGDTLVRPVGGAWFPGPRFADLLRAHGADEPAPDLLDAALRAGYGYLESNHALAMLDEERAAFAEYYRLVLEGLGIARSPELLSALATALVDELNVELFPDTVETLRSLRERGLRLGVISNAWPSLEPKYGGLGIRNYFDAFVISAQAGCVKPDARIYRLGLAGLGLAAEDVLFADDWPGHVETALALSMRGVVIDRTGEHAGCGLPRVASLTEVLDLLV